MRAKNITWIIFTMLLTLGMMLVLPSHSQAGKIREYWIAAEKVTWNYAPTEKNLIEPEGNLGVWGQTLVQESNIAISVIPTADIPLLYRNLSGQAFWVLNYVLW